MSLAAGYSLLVGAPSPLDSVRLRSDAGLSPKTLAQAEAAVAGSWAFRRVVTEGGDVVAMGRVVGDGGWYFVVADMATLTEHQGRGLGGAVLDGLLEDIRARAEPGASVTLTADPPGRRLYESRGFSDVAPARTGMSRLL